MIGIVSLLTDEAYVAVQDGRRQLRERHGLSSAGTFHPHLTYLLGKFEGELDDLMGRVAELAAGTDPFPIRAQGLGVFAGLSPVLYLPVPRSPTLAAVYQSLYHAFTQAGVVIPLYYRPENWLPHVTLLHDELMHKMLPAVLKDLPADSFNLSSQLTGFCLVEQVGEDGSQITREFPFRGQNELGPNPFGLTSRPCQPSDRDFVYQLVKETLRPYISAFHPWDEALFDRRFADAWRDRVIILSEGRPVGYISYNNSAADHFYISGLFLTPTVHGRGWGKWLLNYVEGLAQGRPTRLHVLENNPAIGFYQRHGYQIAHTRGHKHLMTRVHP